MAEKPNNNNGEYSYKQTDWRRYVEYRLDELKDVNANIKGNVAEILLKIDKVVIAGIITPTVLDQKLKDQKEACMTQFKKPDNPDFNGLKGGWSLAKWGIKEFGVFGFLAAIIVGQFIFLAKAYGII